MDSTSVRSSPRVPPDDSSALPSSFACPCCRFRLPEDGWFLPSSHSSGAAQHDEDASTTKAGPRPSAKKDAAALDEERNVPSPREAYEILRRRQLGGRGEAEGSEEEGGEDGSANPPPFLLLVDTHCHAHLDPENRSSNSIYTLPDDDGDDDDEEEAGEEDIIGSDADNATNGRGGAALSSPRRRRRRRQRISLVSLTCGVAPSDWDACLAHAAASHRRVPALGVHPWYLDEILECERNSTSTEMPDDPSSKAAVESARSQSPLPSPLPSPLASAIANGGWLQRLKSRLLEHPGCLVGEIGLCRRARFVRTHEGGKAEALALQRQAFRAQLLVACELRRSASVHCVDRHRALLEVLQSLVPLLLSNQQKQQQEQNAAATDGASSSSPTTPAEEGCTGWTAACLYLPPAIALHSFTGTAHQVRQLLEWEATVPAQLRFPPGTWVGSEQEGDGALPPPPLLYFGFSHAVNVAMAATSSAKSQRQNREAVRAVPLDRLLAESDVSSPSDAAGGTLGAVAYLAAAATAREGESGQQGSDRCQVAADSLLRMARLTSENGIRFLRQQQQPRQREDE